MVQYIVVYKHGNTILDITFKARSATEALEQFFEPHSGVIAVMPLEVYELLPDPSVFLGRVYF